MTKIDVFSGFLGAGKTTLIKKLIREAFSGEKLVLIENEFGEIGIDGGFLQDAGIEITEMNSGCICCSLVGDFGEALQKVVEQFHPDRILIEPSGVGKLSDVMRAVLDAGAHGVELNSATTIIDANKCKMYMKNFGEFYNNQVENANAIILSRTAGMSQEKLQICIDLLRQHNKDASIITTDWAEISGQQILAAMEKKNTLEEELKMLQSEQEHHHHHHGDDDEEECECGCHHHHDDDDEEEHEHHHHHHHGDDDEEECECGCHHHHDDDDEEEHEHHHHHHHDDDDDDEEEHEHHHHHHDHEEHDEHCTCGCHDHDHHHHHHADEVFTSWGVETAKKFTAEKIGEILKALDNREEYGMILRAKGIVDGENGWIYFDFVPGEPDIRTGSAAVTGRLCVIGSGIQEKKLSELFGV